MTIQAIKKEAFVQHRFADLPPDFATRKKYEYDDTRSSAYLHWIRVLSIVEKMLYRKTFQINVLKPI